MKLPRLELWRLTSFDTLVGVVYHHPRFQDGDRIHTSAVKTLDFEKRRARTRNTTYELGVPA